MSKKERTPEEAARAKRTNAVVMMAAAMCIIGRQRELAETDTLKATAIATAANRMFDTAIAIMSGKAPSSSTYARTSY